MKTASSADDGYERTWATRAAAIAAKSQLQGLGQRRPQQSAAGSWCSLYRCPG